jgi:hypothetical protein
MVRTVVTQHQQQQVLEEHPVLMVVLQEAMISLHMHSQAHGLNSQHQVSNLHLQLMVALQGLEISNMLNKVSLSTVDSVDNIGY